MRLGGRCFTEHSTPEAWVEAMRSYGYSAAYCPVATTDEDVLDAYAKAAAEADIVIAEIGCFGNNPLSPDEDIRKQSFANSRERLAMAERIGARCCVNCSGSRGERWAGPDDANLTSETFDLIVESVREIIDGVNPTRTFFTLEPMPYMYPDSADSYLDLIRAVDREAFAVHFDPVNIVTSPQIYYNTGAFLRDCFAKLGPLIRSCHAKDIILKDELTVHMSETMPGRGNLDFATYLRELDKLDPDTPLMIEHLKTEPEYAEAADHIRSVASEVGVRIL